MIMKNITLAIDLGSTSFKAAIFAADMHLLGEAGYKIAYLKADEKIEIAHEEVDQAIQTVVSQAVSSAKIAITDITAVGIASQAQTFTFIDANGTPVRPFISWLDNRAVKTCEAMRNKAIFNDFSEHCSVERLYPTMQICLVRHLMNEPNANYANCQLVSLPSYIIYRLTGSNVTDNNMSALDGFYSLQTQSWYKPYLDYCNLTVTQMPELIKVGEIAGQVTGETFLDLPMGCNIFSCGNDQTAGAYGAELSLGDILVNLGTAHITYACRKNLPEPEYNLCRGEYPGELYYAMCSENGGAILTAILAAFPEFESFDNLASLAEQANNHSIIFNINIDTLNSFSWSDENATLAAKAYAVFDYLAERIKIMTDIVSDHNSDVKKIYLTGGGRKNRILVNLIKEKIGKNIIELETSPLQGVALNKRMRA
jgi:sugar (pentulose or hexulose) kinase